MVSIVCELSSGLCLTICADHRVDSLQRGAVVQWRSARRRSQWVAQSSRLFVEELCIVFGGQSLQVSGHRRRQAVVNLVHRSPELAVVSITSYRTTCEHDTYSITTSLRERVDFQHRIIRWRRLEGDIRMPSHACIATGIAELVCQSTALLLLL